MRPPRHRAPRGPGIFRLGIFRLVLPRPVLRGLLLAGLAVASLLLLDAAGAVPRKDKPKIPAVRWDEEHPGCTFSRSDDGHYHYGLWYEDIGITMSVDSQELEKVHRRHEPFFGVLLSVRYRGQGTVDVGVENISLEFVKHFQVVQTSLDPDGFAEKVQNDADELDHQTAREVEKHPEKKEEKEAYVKAFLKDCHEPSRKAPRAKSANRCLR